MGSSRKKEIQLRQHISVTTAWFLMFQNLGDREESTGKPNSFHTKYQGLRVHLQHKLSVNLMLYPLI